MNLCSKTGKECRLEFQMVQQGVRYEVCADCGEFQQQFEENHGC